MDDIFTRIVLKEDDLMNFSLSKIWFAKNAFISFESILCGHTKVDADFKSIFFKMFVKKDSLYSMNNMT